MKILFNHVAVKIPRHEHELILHDGKKLFIDNSFMVGHHMVRTGIVTNVPERLHFEYFDGLSLEYHTDIEVQVGDQVIFHHLAVNYTKNESYGLQDQEYPIRYDGIFCAIRNGEVIPLNGNVIVEPLKEPMTSQFIPVKNSVHHGIVKYLGSPLKGYFMTPDGSWSDKGIDIKQGDHVVYGKVDCVPLEFSLHQTLDKGTTLFRMRRKDIVAKI